MWACLEFITPGPKAPTPTFFRDALASRLDGTPGIGILFNYSEGGAVSGRPLHRRPLFRFDRKGSRLRVLAVGEGAKLLADLAPDISRAAKLVLGEENCAVAPLATGKTVASAGRRLYRYRVPFAVVQRHAWDHHRFEKEFRSEKPSRELLAWLEERIRTGLNRDMYIWRKGLAKDGKLPPPPDYLLGDVSVRGFVPVKVKGERLFMGATGLEFTSNLYLEGVFHVGHLINRGYGLIVSAEGGKRVGP